MTRRPAMPRPAALAVYWHARDTRFVPTLDEAACFACGYVLAHRPPAEHRTGHPHAFWDRAGLDRAHIVPHALGGTVTPSNLLLLCPPCHAVAPNVAHPTALLEWCRRRPSYEEQLAADLRRYGLDTHPGAHDPLWWELTDRLLEALAGTHGVVATSQRETLLTVARLAADVLHGGPS